ncbi:MAG: TonB family protein [Candidatus Acidiferrum sp.]
MALIEKDANPAAAAASRVQPVALEIPVTITGGRAVEGSEKREPFSESTTTVLVFPHGTIIRVSATLVPAQRVSLFNEKTKREVVCQVVKSRPAGSDSRFVELQFTEPVVNFWGLPNQADAVDPAAGLAAAPVAPSPKAAPAPLTPPAKPATAAPPAPPAAKPEHATRQSVPLASSTPNGPVVAPPPVAAAPKSQPAQATASANSATQTNRTPVPPPSSPTPKTSPAQAGGAPPSPTIPPAPILPKPLFPTSALLDFSKEIDALLAGTKAAASRRVSRPTPAPTTPATPAAPAPHMPSVEQLKQFAARLQQDLGSLPLTATPAAPPPPSPPPVSKKPEPPAVEAVKTVLKVTPVEPKPVVKNVSEPVVLPTQRQTQVQPQVQAKAQTQAQAHPQPQTQAPTQAQAQAQVSPSVDSTLRSPVNSKELFRPLVVEEPRLPQADVFDTKSFDEFSDQPDHVTSAGSKRRLSLGLGAGALLIVGAGTWYFLQNHSGTTTAATGVPLSSPAAMASPQPVNNATPEPARAASIYPLKPRTSNHGSGNSSPAESAKTPALQNFTLGPPVVNHAASPQQSGEDLPKFEGNPSAGSVLLPVRSDRPKAPASPVPIGGDLTPAQLLRSVQPEYPQLARKQGISGHVQMDALIDASGNVAAVKVLSGPPMLQRAALDAVKQWKYSPALLDGQPTSTHLNVSVQFGGSENPSLSGAAVNRGAGSQGNPRSAGLEPFSRGGYILRNDPTAFDSVGGDLKPAQLLSSVPPVFPLTAKERSVYGNVQIDALIDASGNVAKVKALSGPAILQHAAMDAVKQWKYSPAVLDGQPTSMHLNVTVQFGELENSTSPGSGRNRGSGTGSKSHSTGSDGGYVLRNDPNAPLPADLRPPQLTKSVEPVYPLAAKQQNISGNVQIDALIDASGNVGATKILSGPPLLQRAALDAVKQWKYTPALLSGQPISMHLTLTVEFRNR